VLKSSILLFTVIGLFQAPQAASPSKPAAAAKPIPSAISTQPLDQEKVRRLYGEGDFDPAIAILEDFQKTHLNSTREESLLVYKYLGVMYCADQGTREKGKSYFYKLLKIDPEAKILDMYVSIVVQEIFKGTLDELMGQSSGRPAGPREDKVTVQDPKSPKGSLAVPKDKGEAKVADKKGHPAYWWIGGLAVAAGIAGGYYAYTELNAEPEQAPPTDIPISF
jgi:hypothetical protein